MRCENKGNGGTSILNPQSSFPVLFDARDLYDAYHRGRPGPLRGGGCRVARMTFESACAGELCGEDRDCEENLRFGFPVFLPEGAPDPRCDDLVVILNGLNETAYIKLFPWALNLARLTGRPTAIFPTAFHLNRRPRSWLPAAQALYRERAALPGNHKASPYNAALSQGLSARPGRFFRGGLQTCGDLKALARSVREGSHPQLSAVLSREARMHFLGYSAGGYVALVLLLADEEGLFRGSRCALFASCADRDGVDPGSILILDSEASARVMDYYGGGGYAGDEDAEVRDWLVNRPEGVWFRKILGGRLAGAGLGGRVMAAVGAKDKVIAADSVVRTLRGVPVEVMDLGIHEYPFNIAGPLEEAYASSAARALLREIGESAGIGASYRGPFEAFIRKVANFL